MLRLTKDSIINTGIAAAIVGATFATYWQVHDFEFLNYEDNAHVTENPYVMNGVTRDGIIAAFTKPQNGGWYPVATLTHMIDVDIFGLDPGPPHIINVLFHCSNAVVLFFLLFAMTGARWPSATVAALFALHPLHVEAVAWISSRKDLLSMHFMLMTVRFYLKYVERPSWKFYLLVAVHFLAALLSKPMAVTLPVLLLFLDYWPLRRVADASPVLAEKKRAVFRLIREKLPLFVCAGVVCAVAVLAQRSGGAPGSFVEYSLYERIGNATVSYIVYIGVTLWPVNLLPFYPHPGTWPLIAVLGSAMLLLLVTAIALLRLRKSPYFIVGWGWWLVSLLPVAGFVQIGDSVRADRFTYLPHIGLFIVFAWGVDELTRRVPKRKPVLAACTVVLLVPALMATYHQVSHWRNTVALFEYTLSASPDNPVAHNKLGVELMRRAASPGDARGDMEAAEAHLRAAVQFAPAYADAHNNLGLALMLQGKEGSTQQFETALALNPSDVNALINAANALLESGAVDDAIAYYRRAINVAPANADARNNLGLALTHQGNVDEAVAEYRVAVELQPDDASLRASLANGLLRLNKVSAAAEQALAGVKLDPENADAQYNLGVALFTMGRTDDGIEALQVCVDLDPDFLDAHRQLASALAGEGRTDEAIRHYEEMVRIHPGDRRAVRAIEILKSGDQPGTPPNETGGMDEAAPE